ncbi:TfoX/Sxy family protein [Dyella halodurans]|uniref:TfoX/Sxy family protein n=1 Tax=Dyella halodurans TaxID=1920171 RepID=A0ABV9BX31_9GAMM|nr:TfoX/Sxy family protein [Dyella halodurans]
MSLALDALRRDLEDAATHLGRPHELRFHPMFGGLMAYFGEKPCAWLSTQGLALKLAADDQAELLAREGARRFEARPGLPPSRQYIVLPPSLCADTAQLARWLERSAQAIAKAQKKGPRPKTRP